MSFDRFGIMTGFQISRPFVCDETAPTLEAIMAEVPNYADTEDSITVVEILAINEEGFATKVRDIFQIFTHTHPDEIEE